MIRLPTSTICSTVNLTQKQGRLREFLHNPAHVMLGMRGVGRKTPCGKKLFLCWWGFVLPRGQIPTSPRGNPHPSARGMRAPLLTETVRVLANSLSCTAFHYHPTLLPSPPRVPARGWHESCTSTRSKSCIPPLKGHYAHITTQGETDPEEDGCRRCGPGHFGAGALDRCARCLGAPVPSRY